MADTSPPAAADGAPADNTPSTGTTGDKPGLTPEMIRAMMPRPSDLLKVHRRVTWVLAGCFTLIVAGILLALFLPYWELDHNARELVKSHLQALEEQQRESAWSLCTPGLMDRADFDARAARFSAALTGGQWRIDDFMTEDGRTWVTGQVTAADGTVRAFRYQIVWDEASGELRVALFAFRGRNTG